MNKFRIGDKVTTLSGTKIMTVANQVDNVVWVQETPYPFSQEVLTHALTAPSNAEVLDKILLEVFKDVDEAVISDTKGDQWEFTVTSEDAIQYCTICDELSYAEPLAFLTYNEREFVVIHDSLSNKGNKCKGNKKIAMIIEDEVLDYTPCDNGSVLELKGIKSRKAVKAWAKAVKMASWKKPYRSRGLVRVTKVAV